MDCEHFRQFELGNIDEPEFKQHVMQCEICRKQIQQKDQLMGLVKTLKQPVNAPGLWDRIEVSLQTEQKRSRPWHKPYWFFMRIAAILIIAVSIGFYFLARQPQSQTLLTDSALKNVEQKEQEYEAAIEQLENIALPKLSEMDIQLMLLYKDRLETIDTQIAQCKEALEANPANAHIRRYLLAALRDKKETLNELLNMKNQKM